MLPLPNAFPNFKIDLYLKLNYIKKTIYIEEANNSRWNRGEKGIRKIRACWPCHFSFNFSPHMIFSNRSSLIRRSYLSNHVNNGPYEDINYKHKAGESYYTAQYDI